MNIVMKSILTGQMNARNVDLSPEQYKRWKRGEFIQHVAPHLSVEDREFLVTGITPEEERNLLPPEDEEAWGC